MKEILKPFKQGESEFEENFIWRKINFLNDEDKLFELLSHPTRKSVISLCSGVALEFLRLYHSFGFERLLGLELGDENWAINDFEKLYPESIIPPLSKYNSVFEHYDKHYEFEATDKTKVSLKEFNRLLRPKYGDESDIVTYLSLENFPVEKFDFVICSRVFSAPGLTEQISTLLPQTFKLLSENGIYYFSITQQTDNRIDFDLINEIISKKFKKGVFVKYLNKDNSIKGLRFWSIDIFEEANTR